MNLTDAITPEERRSFKHTLWSARHHLSTCIQFLDIPKGLVNEPTIADLSHHASLADNFWQEFLDALEALQRINS